MSLTRLHVVAFGCQMSAADSEEMARPFLAAGLSLTSQLEEADAVLVNTCTVREQAENRALSLIGRLEAWKEARPGRLVVVAGCAAERWGESLKERFPHVDLVSGAKSIEQFPAAVREALKGRFDWASENAGAWPAPGADNAPGTTRREHGLRVVSAYVTVMRGCNYSCAYCIVPAVRGREVYRPLARILEEVRGRVAEGAREVMLLGQTVNSYHAPDGGSDFAGLLRALEGVAGLGRVRFMSPHPYFVGTAMAQAMADSSKVCRHLHLPLQSGSDRVLGAMRRNYTASSFLAKVRDLRRRMPDLELTTDVIVGFPGESEEDFSLTLRALEEMEACSAYCFRFSPRPETEGASLPGRLPPAVLRERLARVLEAVEARRRRSLASWVGRRARVLVEDAHLGRTQGFFRAKVDRGRIGELVEGPVTASTAAGLVVRADVAPAPDY